MAILVNGMKCPICNNAIKSEDNVVSFPPFVTNLLDLIFGFSDAIMHKECFINHSLAKKAEERYNELVYNTGPGKRKCWCCNNQITNPDDYIGIGHLTDDKTSSLYRYNYLQIHRSCLNNWDETTEFLCFLKKLRDSNKWGGEYLNNLIGQLE